MIMTGGKKTDVNISTAQELSKKKKIELKKDRQCTLHVTVKCVRVTTVAVEKQ